MEFWHSRGKAAGLARNVAVGLFGAPSLLLYSRYGVLIQIGKWNVTRPRSL